MRETAFALGVIATLAFVQVLAHLFATPSLLTFGLALIASGLFVSIPAALVYHLRLAQVLSPRGLLKRGWLWHPTKLHVHLQGGERVSVLAWFFLGVLGWLAALGGCALVGVSLLGLVA